MLLRYARWITTIEAPYNRYAVHLLYFTTKQDVLIAPGQMQLKFIFFGASSKAKDLVIAIIPQYSTESSYDCYVKYRDDSYNGRNYDTTRLVDEILDKNTESPKLFVINLPEADIARYFCSEFIYRVFRKRKNNFDLIPRVVFVFGEAQEFIPADKRKEDGTDTSRRTVERFLRHGRKYNLNAG